MYRGNGEERMLTFCCIVNRLSRIICCHITEAEAEEVLNRSCLLSTSAAATPHEMEDPMTKTAFKSSSRRLSTNAAPHATDDQPHTLSRIDWFPTDLQPDDEEKQIFDQVICHAAEELSRKYDIRSPIKGLQVL